MTELKKDHVLGTGGGAVAAGAVGAAIGGVVAGPPGLALGAAAGTAIGAVLGSKASRAIDDSGNVGSFEDFYQTMPYYVDGMTWDDYRPAYQLGLDAHPQSTPGTAFSAARGGMEQRWDQVKGSSRLQWSEAEPAAAHAWEDLDKVRRAEVVNDADTPVG